MTNTHIEEEQQTSLDYIAMLDYRLNECESMLLNHNLNLQTRNILMRQNEILLGCYQQAVAGAFEEFPEEAMDQIRQVFEHSRKVLDKVRDAFPEAVYDLNQIMPSNTRIQ